MRQLETALLHRMLLQLDSSTASKIESIEEVFDAVELSPVLRGTAMLFRQTQIFCANAVSLGNRENLPT